MKEIQQAIIHVLEKQGFVIVSTLDAQGKIHCAAKGLVGVEPQGKVYVMDLYQANTFNNLKINPTISITAIDDQAFVGFTLRGKGFIIEREKIKSHIIEAWEERIINRISKRVIRGIQKEKRAAHHPEAKLPHPKYLIEIDVEDIVDLSPGHLKRPS